MQDALRDPSAAIPPETNGTLFSSEWGIAGPREESSIPAGKSLCLIAKKVIRRVLSSRP